MKKILSMVGLVVFSLIVLSGCDQTLPAEEGEANVSQETTKTFKGTKGDFIALANDEIKLSIDEIDDGKAHFYNTALPDGEPIYFFVVKSPDGNFRAAANGCQVCGNALQGFYQEGDKMVCNTCGNSYSLDKIATEKGGCNPAPINPDLAVVDNSVSISLEELKGIKQFFN